MSLGQASGLLGTKEKIQQSFRIKEEADKALEKLPEDAATHFLLGKWCLGVCSLAGGLHLGEERQERRRGDDRVVEEAEVRRRHQKLWPLQIK